MWIPTTEDEITQAVTSGSLEETTIFDAKKELPSPSKNAEIAKDVAAMTNDGGVLIYGIDEDAQGRPTVLHPIPLADQRERIDSIVRSSITEQPKIGVSAIPTAANADEGYIIVVVPASERAPHMVVVKGDHRYYGRTATGNYPLTEGEVARLYERRQRWEANQQEFLNEVMSRAPIEPHPDFAYLHLAIKPLLSSESLIDNARKDDSVPTLLNSILERTLRPMVFSGPPSYPHFPERASWHRQLEGWIGHFAYDSVSTPQREPTNILDLQVNNNGSGYLFCGRVAQRKDMSLLLFEPLIAELVTRCLWIFGQIYKQARYTGPVDVGLAITGLQGATSSTLRQRVIAPTTRPIDRAEYRRFARVLAMSLPDTYQAVAQQLVMDLIDAATQETYKPFK